MKKFVKNIKKILEKVCTCKNNAYLCIRNQEMSSYKTKQNVANRKIRKRLQKETKKSLQKVLEKFGGYKKRFYLCNRFPPQIGSGVFQTVL